MSNQKGDKIVFNVANSRKRGIGRRRRRRRRRRRKLAESWEETSREGLIFAIG
jgi:hypothetical protein